MKNTIIFTMMLIIMISFAYAEDLPVGEEPQEEVTEPPIQETTQLGVQLTTDQNVEAVIIENAEGTIDNTIVCNSASCITNIHGGSIVPAEGQVFNYNDYKTEYITKHGGGLSIGGLTEQLGESAQAYYMRDKNHASDSAWNLWGLLDAMFVSHRESSASFNNVVYLANKMDKLEAKINVLEKLYNLENNTEYQKLVDAEEIRLYANRTGDFTCFEDGQCIVVRTVG